MILQTSSTDVLFIDFKNKYINIRSTVPQFFFNFTKINLHSNMRKQNHFNKDKPSTRNRQTVPGTELLTGDPNPH